MDLFNLVKLIKFYNEPAESPFYRNNDNRHKTVCRKMLNILADVAYFIDFFILCSAVQDLIANQIHPTPTKKMEILI